MRCLYGHLTEALVTSSQPPRLVPKFAIFSASVIQVPGSASDVLIKRKTSSLRSTLRPGDAVAITADAATATTASPPRIANHSTVTRNNVDRGGPEQRYRSLRVARCSTRAVRMEGRSRRRPAWQPGALWPVALSDESIDTLSGVRELLITKTPGTLSHRTQGGIAHCLGDLGRHGWESPCHLGSVGPKRKLKRRVESAHTAVVHISFM
jgi:hypothetical protein